MKKTSIVVLLALIAIHAKAESSLDVIPTTCVAEHYLNGNLQTRYEGACRYQQPMTGAPREGTPIVTPPPLGFSFTAGSAHKTNNVPPGFHARVHIAYNLTKPTENTPTWVGIEYNIVKDKGKQVVKAFTTDGKEIEYALPQNEQMTGRASSVIKRGEMVTVMRISDFQDTDEIRIGFF